MGRAGRWVSLGVLAAVAAATLFAAAFRTHWIESSVNRLGVAFLILAISAVAFARLIRGGRLRMVATLIGAVLPGAIGILCFLISDPVRVLALRIEVDHRVKRLFGAIGAYRSEYGRLPESLEELAGQDRFEPYLLEIPCRTENPTRQPGYCYGSDLQLANKAASIPPLGSCRVRGRMAMA